MHPKDVEGMANSVDLDRSLIRVYTVYPGHYSMFDVNDLFPLRLLFSAPTMSFGIGK